MTFGLSQIDHTQPVTIPPESPSELSPRVLSVATHNALLGHSSTPRIVMDSNHISQHQVLVRSQKKETLLSGVEYELGKYIDDVRVDRDCRVTGSIQKLHGSPHNPETMIFTQYEENGQIWFDIIKVPTYRSKHSYFGYSLIPQEKMLNMTYGSVLRDGDILATSNSLADDGCFKYGRNVNVVYSSDVATGEDGFVASESLCKALEFEVVESRVFDITMDNFLINLYGDEHIMKLLPNIGESVKNREILAAMRERDDFLSIVDLNESDIGRIDHSFDKKCMVEIDSVVVDVRIIKGSNPKPVFSDNMVEQLEEFQRTDLKYAEGIYSQYQRQMRDVKKQFGSNIVPNLTPRMTHIVEMAKTLLETRKTKRKLMYGRRMIDQYRVEVVTKTVVRPDKGYKLTDLFGGRKLPAWTVKSNVNFS